VLLVLLAISWIVQAIVEKRRAGERARAERAVRTFDPFAGGYPVPPMPGQQLDYRSRREAAAVMVTASAATTTETLSTTKADEEGTDA
jgi:NADH-quinone oxidoreductase subunit H